MDKNLTSPDGRDVFFSSATSPFARKVRIAMRLRELADQFHEVDCDPFFDDPLFHEANPIAQVPALLTADHGGIGDSTLICRYLDTLGDRPPLVSGDVPIEALAIEAVANGIMECSVRLRAEISLRGDGERSEYWMARWRSSIHRSLSHLNEQRFAKDLDIAAIATGCALFYLDLRHADIIWRSFYPNLLELGNFLVSKKIFEETQPSIPIEGSSRLRGSSDPLPSSR